MYNDISRNAGDLASALTAIGKQIEDDVFNKIIRRALLLVLAKIVKDTPRDTGRAMGSWSISTEFKDWKLPEGDYSSTDFVAAIEQEFSTLSPSDKYVIFNNLEYIVALEDGHSKRAPAGFVAQALASIGSYIAREARAAGHGGTA